MPQSGSRLAGSHLAEFVGIFGLPVRNRSLAYRSIGIMDEIRTCLLTSTRQSLE